MRFRIASRILFPTSSAARALGTHFRHDGSTDRFNDGDDDDRDVATS